MVRWVSFAALSLAILAASAWAQEKRPSASATLDTKPSLSQNDPDDPVSVIREGIEKAKNTRDVEEKFRLQRGLRLQIARAIEDVGKVRASLIDEIARLRSIESAKQDASLEMQLAEQEANLSRVQEVLNMAKQDSQDFVNAKQEEAYRKSMIGVFKKRLTAIEKEGELAKSLRDKKLDELNGQDARTLRSLGQLLSMQSTVDDELSTALKLDSQRNDFKTLIAFSFAFLVGIVILGFFWVAHSDDTVRRSIFSSESGIQFLTLFSIVIAIILFGVTGILESKELSALLGGLSGFILGRVTPKPAGAQ